MWNYRHDWKRKVDFLAAPFSFPAQCWMSRWTAPSSLCYTGSLDEPRFTVQTWMETKLEPKTTSETTGSQWGSREAAGVLKTWHTLNWCFVFSLFIIQHKNTFSHLLLNLTACAWWVRSRPSPWRAAAAQSRVSDPLLPPWSSPARRDRGVFHRIPQKISIKLPTFKSSF